jgi:hypothetical protein
MMQLRGLPTDVGGGEVIAVLKARRNSDITAGYKISAKSCGLITCHVSHHLASRKGESVQREVMGWTAAGSGFQHR